MDQKQATLEKEVTTRFPVLYVAFELGNSTWKMACSDGKIIAKYGRSSYSQLFKNAFPPEIRAILISTR